MISNTRQSRWLMLGGLVLLVTLGGYLRLFDLGFKSITHPEMYVPGIRMPEGLSEPRQRLTLAKVLTGTFSSDTHPPGYYVLMWFWTKCFGTGIRSIRLPSALFGIGCIPLVFWVGNLAGQEKAGWVAAALLAVNGYHVFWSKVARMFSLACFLGLLATALLLLLARANPPRRSLQFAYGAVILFGLTSHIFFWTVLATHLLWTFLNAVVSKQPMPAVFRLQMLILILGSPLLAFSAYQSGNVVAVLSSDVPLYVREFLQFSFLFPLEGASTGVYLPSSPVPLVEHTELTFARGAFLAFSVLLLILGIQSIRKPSELLLASRDGPSRKSWIGAAGLGVMAILVFVFMAQAFATPKPNPTLRITKVLLILPPLLAVLAILLENRWHSWPNWARRVVDNRFFRGTRALLLLLALVPFLILAGFSLFRPTLNARGMLFETPYLLFVLANGLISLGRQRWMAIPLVLLLGGLHFESVAEYRRYVVDSADFKALAKALASRAQKADLVFLRRVWSSTPILYYLKEDQYRLVGQNYAEACWQNPNSRVWVLYFYRDTFPQEADEALGDYQVALTIEVPHARAVLYTPKAP